METIGISQRITLRIRNEYGDLNGWYDNLSGIERCGENGFLKTLN